MHSLGMSVRKSTNIPTARSESRSVTLLLIQRGNLPTNQADNRPIPPQYKCSWCYLNSANKYNNSKVTAIQARPGRFLFLPLLALFLRNGELGYFHWPFTTYSTALISIGRNSRTEGKAVIFQRVTIPKKSPFVAGGLEAANFRKLNDLPRYAN